MKDAGDSTGHYILKRIHSISIEVSEYYENILTKTGSIKGPQFLVHQTKVVLSGPCPCLQML